MNFTLTTLELIAAFIVTAIAIVTFFKPLKKYKRVWILQIMTTVAIIFGAVTRYYYTLEVTPDSLVLMKKKFILLTPTIVLIASTITLLFIFIFEFMNRNVPPTEIELFFERNNLGKLKKKELDYKIHEIANPENGYPIEDQNIANKLIALVVVLNSKKEKTHQINGVSITDKELHEFSHKYIAEFINDEQHVVRILESIKDINSKYTKKEKLIAQGILNGKFDY